MPGPEWNERYKAASDLPWDTGRPDDHLVKLVESGVVKPCKALEVGCGTGTNSIWLAEQGFEVLGVDLAEEAVGKARVKLGDRKLNCQFQAMDFLHGHALPGGFGFVFDRGCFHVFDLDSERDAFARNVAAQLAPGGIWFSLIGSTEGAPREVGPPRRTAREVVLALEPHLEIVELRSTVFDSPGREPALAWHCLSRRRQMPAQPSTRR